MKSVFVKHLTGIYGRLNKIKILLSKEHNKSHIAMFHNIKADAEKLDSEYDCYISNLEDYVKYCSSNGIKIVSLDTLINRSEIKDIKNIAILTFDDGYESVYTLVSEKMKELNVPFTIYVNTELLGQKGYLSETQLKELSAMELCTIGMHSHKHIMFRYTSNQFLKEDFEECRAKLTEILGVSPKHYAFPYGSVYAVSRKNIKCVKKAGVSTIALTKQCMLSRRNIKHPFALPRLDIPGYYNGRVNRRFRGIGVGNID